MNWTGGGLNRHTSGKSSTSRRQAQHFAKVRLRKQPDHQPTASSPSRVPQIGAACSGPEPNVAALTAQRQTKKRKRKQTDNDTGTIEKGRQQLLQTDDWLGLKRAPLHPLPKTLHGQPQQKVLGQASKDGTKSSRPQRRTEVEPPRFMHGALPSDAISVRIGTAALAPSSQAVVRRSTGRSQGATSRERVRDCTLRSVTPYEPRTTASDRQSANEALQETCSNLQFKNFRNDEQLIATRPPGPATQAVELVEDEHYYSLPQSLQHHDQRAMFATAPVPGRVHTESASTSPSHAETMSDLFDTTGHATEQYTLFAGTPTAPRGSPTPAPDVGYNDKVTSSSVVVDESSSVVDPRTHEAPHPLQALASERQAAAAAAPASSPQAASITDARPDPKRASEDLWRRFIFGSDADDDNDATDTARLSLVGGAQARPSQLETASLVAMVSSSSDHDGVDLSPLGTARGRGRGSAVEEAVTATDWRSTIATMGESRTRAIVVGSSDVDEDSESESDEEDGD